MLPFFYFSFIVLAVFTFYISFHLFPFFHYSPSLLYSHSLQFHLHLSRISLPFLFVLYYLSHNFGINFCISYLSLLRMKESVITQSEFRFGASLWLGHKASGITPIPLLLLCTEQGSSAVFGKKPVRNTPGYYYLICPCKFRGQYPHIGNDRLLTNSYYSLSIIVFLSHSKIQNFISRNSIFK